ncbi:MAG TPA: response regulator [Syntrophales bacterium]|nr:response regulator [Syntrophales bacterium]HOL60192.1 response regulator [Syntrophales bacterium]HPO36318.1 response regulator [Syntrophales bacterium]
MEKKSIMVVDDEDINIGILVEWLELMDYEVIAARSGEEALKIFEERNGAVDLIILDIVMPGLSGEEVFYRLKEMDASVKVIVISGYALEDKVTRLLRAGALSFLQKPFRMENFSEKVKEALNLPQ